LWIFLEWEDEIGANEVRGYYVKERIIETEGSEKINQVCEIRKKRTISRRERGICKDQ
jgi:hypothetical protein